MFDIDKELNVFTRKSIPGKLIFKNGYREWMETLVGDYRELTESYMKYIGDDGRLVGIEKNTLKVKLESLLYLMVSLLQSLENDSKSHILEENRAQDLNLMFFTVSSFEIKGAVSSKKLSQRRDLRKWLNEYLSPQMQSLIASLGKSLLDGEIMPEEKTEILHEAYQLLVELIYINITIEYSELNS